MEIRTMRRSEWSRILERDYVQRPFRSGGFEGFESIIVMNKVRDTLKVKSGEDYVTVVEQGYSWLQIAAKDRSVWMTAMFDPDDNFIQLYFDITAKNILDDGEPRFRDMYLDVILTPKLTHFVLDEDELDDALKAGDITKDEYNAAHEACKRLALWLKTHASETVEYCKNVQKSLKTNLSLLRKTKELASDSPAQQFIAVSTSKANVYSFANADVASAEDEDGFIEILRAAGDTVITNAVCMWRDGTVDLPSARLRKLLLELDPQNADAELLLQADYGFNTKKLKITIPPGR